MSIDELTVLTCGIGEYSWEFLGLQGDQASQPKGNQSWVFIEKTDAEAETPILWPHDAKNWLIRKDLDVGKDWRQEEKGMTVVGWHHRLDGHELEQVLGDDDGKGSLACCSPWGHKESDVTERQNWTELRGKGVRETHERVQDYGDGWQTLLWWWSLWCIQMLNSVMYAWTVHNNTLTFCNLK